MLTYYYAPRTCALAAHLCPGEKVPAGTLSAPGGMVSQGLVERPCSARELVRRQLLSQLGPLRSASTAGWLRMGSGGRRCHPGRYLVRPGDLGLPEHVLVA